jgi:hypothetical protein
LGGNPDGDYPDWHLPSLAVNVRATSNHIISNLSYIMIMPIDVITIYVVDKVPLNKPEIILSTIM